MPKYKIKYWQGGNIESTIIEASCKESASCTFHFMTNFTDIISCDECKTEDDYCKEIAGLTANVEELTTKNESLMASNEELQGVNEALQTEKASLEADNADLRIANNSLLTRNASLETQNGELIAQNEVLQGEITKTEEFNGNLRGVSFAENNEVTELNVDCSNFSSATEMFAYCLNLKTVSMKNTQNIKNWNRFMIGAGIVSVSTLDWSSAETAAFAFADCVDLEEIRYVPKTIRVDFSLFNSPKLTLASLYSIRDAVVDVGEERVIVISSVLWDVLDYDALDALMMELMELNWILS